MVLPNFLHLGPAKSGSTWIHEALGRHPDVFMAEAKDLHFFDRYFDRGVEWYTRQFRDARPEHLVVGEVCQSYLSSRYAPQRVHACLGEDVRLMVTLRDPVERAFSHYLYALRQGKRLGSFRQELRNRPSLVTQSKYGTQLRRYCRLFGAEAIYVAVFDDLRADSQDFFDRMLTWLGLPTFALAAPQRAARLPASSPRSSSAAGAVRRAARWARDHDAAGLVGRLKRSPLVERLLYQPLDRPDTSLGEGEAAYIRTRLDGEIAAVEQLFELRLRERWGWPVLAPAPATAHRGMDSASP